MPDRLARYRPALRFLLVLALATGGWALLYETVLRPDGRPDALVANHLAGVLHGALGALGFDAVREGRVVWGGPGGGLDIVDDCTGLATLGFFVGFVLAYPGAWRRRAWFLPLGVGVVHAVNAARLVGLGVLQQVRPEWFEAVHQWGMPPLFYGTILLLWLVWIRVAEAPRPAPVPVPA